MTRSRTYLVPLIALAGALLVDCPRAASFSCRLTGMDGSPIVIRSSQVFAVYPSSTRIGQNRGSEIQVLGMPESVQVQESVNKVDVLLGRKLQRVKVPGAWLGLGRGSVVALVDPARIVMVDKSIYRMSGSGRSRGEPITDVTMVQNFKLQVFGDVSSVAGSLGM